MLQSPTAVADVLLEALSNLEPHVKFRKPKQCKQTLKEALELNWPAEFSNEIDKLEELLGKYKYKEALKVLETLTQQLR